MTPGPRFVRTPPEALPGRSVRRVPVGVRVFDIESADMVALLDDPAVNAASRADDYMPYWADIWPAARLLAEAVLAEPWVPGTRALELGCGLGLAGVAALSAGLRVTFSDYDLNALDFAAGNAQRNGLADFDTLALDWRHPPAGLTFPVILGADLLYERRNLEPLLDLLDALLEPGGVCLLSDADRPHAAAFRGLLDERGRAWEARPGQGGTVYRLL